MTIFPVICDEHGVLMVRDASYFGWRCPYGNAWYDDEEYLRITQRIGPDQAIPELRVTGCKPHPGPLSLVSGA